MFTPKEMKEAIERIIRPDGTWVLSQTPDVMQEFVAELEEYVLKPLRKKGYSKRDAIALHQTKMLGEMLEQLIRIENLLREDEDE